MLFITLLLTSAVLLFIYLIKLQNERPKNFPPGPPRLPLWGSYWYILWANYNQVHEAFIILAQKYKSKVVGAFLGEIPIVVAMDYETCKEVLTKEEFAGRPTSSFVVLTARGNDKAHGLIFADGGFWQDQRRFTQRHMRDFGLGRRLESIENFTEDQVRHFLDLLRNKPDEVDKDISRNLGEINMPDIFYGYYLNCVWYMLAGRSFIHRELRDVARTAFRFQCSGDPLGGALAMTPWVRYIAPVKSGYKSAVEDNAILFDYCSSIIKEHEETYSEDIERDFIDAYLKELYELEKNDNFSSSYSRKQMAFAILDSMFPAAIGMGHTTNFLFAYLIKYPKIQEKVQEEIDSVVGRSRLPILDDRQNMPYIQAAIREILRKEPINPMGVVRRSLAEGTVGGYTVPKDSLLYANVWSAHHDPKYYDAPFEFRPERWLNKDGSLMKHDPTTISFGGGKRLCIGETFSKNTMFLFITGLLQNYNFSMPEGEVLPDIAEKKFGISISMESYWMRGIERD